MTELGLAIIVPMATLLWVGNGWLVYQLWKLSKEVKLLTK